MQTYEKRRTTISRVKLFQRANGVRFEKAGAARPSYTKPIHPRLYFELNWHRLVVAGARLPAVLSAVASAKEGRPGVKPTGKTKE